MIYSFFILSLWLKKLIPRLNEERQLLNGIIHTRIFVLNEYFLFFSFLFFIFFLFSISFNFFCSSYYFMNSIYIFKFSWDFNQHSALNWFLNVLVFIFYIFKWKWSELHWSLWFFPPNFITFCIHTKFKAENIRNKKKWVFLNNINKYHKRCSCSCSA